MKDKSKKILLIILIFLIIPHTSTSADLIIPKKKPDIAKENIKKNKISNFLIPLKKPSQKRIDKNILITKPEKKEQKKIVGGIILPKSKPLVVKKDKAVVQKKSKYFSEKDFNYARQALKLMEKRNWVDAEKIAKKAKNKSI